MENPNSKDEALRLCEERYQMLFERNIAGIITTTPEGRIVDCNEKCAILLGFDSPVEVKACTAWDFYFDRADREAFISRSRVVESYPGDVVRLRHRSGKPI